MSLNTPQPVIGVISAIIVPYVYSSVNALIFAGFSAEEGFPARQLRWCVGGCVEQFIRMTILIQS